MGGMADPPGNILYYGDNLDVLRWLFGGPLPRRSSPEAHCNVRSVSRVASGSMFEPDPKQPVLSKTKREPGNGAVEQGNGQGAPTDVGVARTEELASEPETTATEPAPPHDATTTRYFAAVFPGLERPLPRELGEAAAAIQEAFDAPVWLLLQNDYGGREYGTMSEDVRDGFFAYRQQLAQCERMAIVIDSPGGHAAAAYKIARLFQRHCGGWSAIVPRYAKSAATLLVMGADQLYMGP
jgi:hypothetical protein